MYDSLASRVYLFIRESIISGELGTEQYISTNELANSLQLSRTPVRDAVNQLAGEGILDLRGRAGAVLHKMTISEYEDYLGMRLALEPYAAELAAKNATYDILNDLKKICKRMAALSKKIIKENFSNKANCLALQKEDETFHRIIHKLTQNEKLCKIIEESSLLTFKIYYPTQKNASALGKTLMEHWRIYKTISRGNSEQAGIWMKRHLQRHSFEAKDAYRKYLDSQPKNSTPVKAQLCVEKFSFNN